MEWQSTRFARNHAHNGEIYAGGVTVSYAFADAGPNDGGFACVPGSHKSRYPIPPGLRTMEDDMGCVEKPSVNAGDALIFMNGAQTHGARPWRAAHSRRTVLFMYSGRTAARQGASRWCLAPEKYWDDEIVSGMTSGQRAVMFGPSSSPQTDGPYLDLDQDGRVVVDNDFRQSLKTQSDTFIQG